MTEQITCSNCETTYRKSKARSIKINGPETAWYVCPKCHRGTEAAPPQQPIGDELPGIDHIREERETPLDTSNESSQTQAFVGSRKSMLLRTSRSKLRSAPKISDF
jgi:hypothetical protein